ncbi:MAG TPA: hypothetical protein VMU57_20255 [Edaphobacter sp.]|uniref:hypothetical protein n=1 Tax=Edaphobacter sp. TaxID=1934404 RepID=UPI002BEFBA73|nr:hypothetical protein [Edaphobacter sp.]HUZ97244.1 hypothetical protein [Edaphobacter sp.]
MRKRFSQGLTVFVAIALLLAGCKASPGSAADPEAATGGSGAQPGAKAGPATYLAGSALSSQLTTAEITDPSLNNMVSATLTIPAGWKLQGISMIMPCTSIGPAPIYRAYSPDGLMQMRGEPPMGWKWNPKYKTDQSGCASISKPISAADFLTYYIGTMQGGVHVVGTMPVPAAFSQWATNFAGQGKQNGARQPQMMQTDNTADTAALRAEVVNGSFVVEERLLAGVVCSVNKEAMYGGQCFARMTVLTAPEGRLDALVQLVDSNNLPKGVAPPQYRQAVMQRLYQQNQRAADQRMAAANARDAAFSQMMYSAFQQNMARSAAQHQQFMQQQESSFESSMNNANASMNARSTAASDWVDYALDQQTVVGPNGVPTNVSNAYSQTWTNGSQWYQTNDPNSNPNGVLQGNWTPTTQVHGNGAPK